MPEPARLARLHAATLDWFATAARDLPWRREGTTPWGVLVSEVMSQQTPVARVAPVWLEWMARWPHPAALAAEPVGEAVRAWGRLGYPRRAMRLHAAAVALTDRFGGEVPRDLDDLRSLPGVGEYTAAAVAAFAFGGRAAVVDTNVRRVQARVVTGVALPSPSLTRAEVALAEQLLPEDDTEAALWNVAVMELGALLCTARAPDCAQCPLREDCAWVAAGSPPYDGAPRKGQAWAGTDRQCRGRIVQRLREHPSSDPPVARAELSPLWPADASQLERCLAALVREGLVAGDDVRGYALP